jgi:hypothetical protein
MSSDNIDIDDLIFDGRIEEASDGHSETYFAKCGCEIQVSTELPIQTPILRMKPCRGPFPCKEVLPRVMTKAWDRWEQEDFNNKETGQKTTPEHTARPIWSFRSGF